jgi:hypothetical protein
MTYGNTDTQFHEKQFFYKFMQKTHKFPCGMNDILIEQGLLGEGEPANNCLPASPPGAV